MGLSIELTHQIFPPLHQEKICQICNVISSTITPSLFNDEIIFKMGFDGFSMTAMDGFLK
jgi:hypothetical protein